MVASEIIVDIIPPLKPTESCGKALNWMKEFKVSHLPVVDTNKYIGIISEEDLFDFNNEKLSIKESKIQLRTIFAYEYQHIFEVMRLMSDNNVSVIPILDKKENYIGCSSLSNLMTLVTNATSVKEYGGIIVLKVNTNDYSLAEIAQIVEGNNARILSSFITSSPDTTEIEITIKINKKELGAVLQTFRRYKYTIVESFQKENDRNEMENRYNHLMKMLDL